MVAKVAEMEAGEKRERERNLLRDYNWLWNDDGLLLRQISGLIFPAEARLAGTEPDPPGAV